MSIAGGVVFRLLDGRVAVGGVTAWPGVTLLIPAFNEELVIGTCVRAGLAVDYPALEILVLDDGSTDQTARVATAAAAGDPRVNVVRDPANRGINLGFERAAHELVAVI